MEQRNENQTQLTKAIDLSIIPVSSNKIPVGSWKQYQEVIPPIEYWYNHYFTNGYIGVITGKVSGNLECIDIDVKNDPTKQIFNSYRQLIPDDLYSRLIVVTTPNNGYHLIYRCPEAIIEPNHQLAQHEDKAVIIETRGEAGYICTHTAHYKVVQGNYDLLSMKYAIPVITAQEREVLLETARSLNRHVPKPGQFFYKETAINNFNADFDIVPVIHKHGWTTVSEDVNKVLLLRPGSSAHHSAAYLKEEKLFFCFSSSTEFDPKKPYNHFQVLQLLDGKGDYKTTLRLLSDYGYTSTGKADKKDVTEDELAEFLNLQNVRYNTFIQEVTLNGRLIQEMDNNTLFIQAKKHFQVNIPRAKYEDTLKSHLIQTVNPIDDFIEKYKERKPNGTFEQWLDCLVLANTTINKETVLYFLKKWYVGMVAQALDGEYPNEFFLALLSTQQGIGKTTFFRKYTLPAELQEYRKEVPISDDEDFKVMMSQNLLIVDDEMDGRTLSEDKTFKAILSRMELPLRRKYDRRVTNLSRKCSFAGCGNQVNVVRERQNRRIIPIELESIDRKKIAEINLIDLFMEAYHLFISGFRYSYDGSDAERINELAGDYLQKTDLDEIIDECITNPSAEKDELQVTPTQLIAALIDKYPIMTRKLNTFTLGKIMADKGIRIRRVGTKKTTTYHISRTSGIVKTLNELIEAKTISIEGFSKK